MKRIFAILAGMLLLVSLLTACGSRTQLQDGYYTAQMSEFSHGWKEYITILVKGGSIHQELGQRLHAEHAPCKRNLPQ